MTCYALAPPLSLKQIAAQIGRSYSWAKKWAKRLAQAPPEDLEVLHSRSRARKTPAPAWDPLILRCVEQIRLCPASRSATHTWS